MKEARAAFDEAVAALDRRPARRGQRRGARLCRAASTASAAAPAARAAVDGSLQQARADEAAGSRGARPGCCSPGSTCSRPPAGAAAGGARRASRMDAARSRAARRRCTHWRAAAQPRSGTGAAAQRDRARRSAPAGRRCSRLFQRSCANVFFHGRTVRRWPADAARGRGAQVRRTAWVTERWSETQSVHWTIVHEDDAGAPVALSSKRGHGRHPKVGHDVHVENDCRGCDPMSLDRRRGSARGTTGATA